MNASHDLPSLRPAATKITVVYEDRITGMRAKQFCDNLKSAMPSEVTGPPAFWRLELLDLPELAEEVNTGLAACDFLVISIRGKRHFPHVARGVIEQWGKRGRERGLSLVVLFDPHRTEARAAEALRAYFRSVTEELGIAFFSLITTAPEGHWDESSMDEYDTSGDSRQLPSDTSRQNDRFCA